MQRLNAKFHADTGKRRYGDMIWRIPRPGGDDAYLVLLLEFQSKPDSLMALRVATYGCLLWQQLVKEERLPSDCKLPPLLGVVLYNGSKQWHASLALRDLVGLPADSPLWRWQPDLRYHLIDVGGLDGRGLEGLDSLPALWFRLENATDPPTLLAVSDAVVAWFARHPGYAAARTVFVEMLGALMAPLGPEHRLPRDLTEMRNMLLERVEKWKQDWKQEGLEAGRQQGLQQGIQEGRQEGRQEGEAALLMRQLSRRFGPLPDWARQRLLAAATADLEEWGLRILDATCLGDIFGPDGA
jgi:hypothetical protein